MQSGIDSASSSPQVSPCLPKLTSLGLVGGGLEGRVVRRRLAEVFAAGLEDSDLALSLLGDGANAGEGLLASEALQPDGDPVRVALPRSEAQARRLARAEEHSAGTAHRLPTHRLAPAQAVAQPSALRRAARILTRVLYTQRRARTHRRHLGVEMVMYVNTEDARNPRTSKVSRPPQVRLAGGRGSDGIGGAPAVMEFTAAAGFEATLPSGTEELELVCCTESCEWVAAV